MKPLKSELTLREFAEAVGRSPATIRRHLQKRAYKNKEGPLYGRATFRYGRWFFAAYLVEWYKQNVKSLGWDERKDT